MTNRSLYAVFERGGDLLKVFGLVRGGWFPDQVIRLLDGRWAVDLTAARDIHGQIVDDPLAVWRQTEAVQTLLAGRVEKTASTPRGASAEIRDAISEALTWRRCDPLAVARGEGPAVLAREGGLSYVLGAKTPEVARKLLDQVLRLEYRGLRMRAFHDQAVHGQTTCRHFLTVAGQPVLGVLETADCAWWGGWACADQAQLFFQWPFVPEQPVDGLTRVPWSVGAGLVLLGRDEPRNVRLRAIGGTPVLDSLCAFASLDLGEGRPAVVLKPVPKSQPLRVRLRLIDRTDHASTIADRILDLGRQIRDLDEQRQALARRKEALEENAHDSELDRSVLFEPLFVYRSDAGSVPDELRHLLIEWPEADLVALRYLRMSAAELDGNNDGQVAHLLTTACAVEHTPSGTTGLRLQAYEPRNGGGPGRFSSFSLVPEWARYGLRLFVPDRSYRQRLEIYPDLPHDDARSADRLAEAMFGSGPARASRDPADRGKLCAVLQPGSHSAGVRVCAIRTSGFLPLAKAFEWHCALDVERVLPDTRTVKGGEAEAALSTAITGAMDNAIDTKLKDWKKERYDRIDAELEQWLAHEQATRALAKDLTAEAHELAKLMDDAAVVIDEISKKQLSPMAKDVAQVNAFAERWNALATSLNELTTREHAVREKYLSLAGDLHKLRAVHSARKRRAGR